MEILVGIMVLGLVAAGLAQGLAQSSFLIGKSKADSIAHKVAAAELDQAHRIDYDDLGTVAGNPPGIIPPGSTKTVSGQSFKVDTSVQYVDDAALGQPKNYVNYKKVVVTVTPLAGTTTAVTQSTLVAPPSIGAIAGKATAIATVVDAKTGLRLQGVGVTIDLSTSPPRTGTTDANGQVVFAGLEPSAMASTDPKYKYRLSAAFTGYVTHSTTTPDVMQQHLAAKQTWNATIKMFKPVTITVNLTDKITGNPVTEAALTTIETDAPVQVESLFGTTGTATFTQVATRPIEPGQYTVKVQPDCYKAVTLPPADMPTGYPTNTAQVVDVALDPLPHGYLDVRVLNAATGAVIPGAKVQVLGGDKDIAPVIRNVDANGWVRYCLSPTVSVKYIVSAVASGFVTQSQLQAVAPNTSTALELGLVPVANSCGIRLDAKAAGKWVRLAGSGGIVFDQALQTSALGDGSFGTAYFPNLLAGTYLAYIESGFSNGAVTWSVGKSVACVAGDQDKKYNVP